MGRRLFPDLSVAWQTYFGTWMAFAGVAVLGALIYWADRLDTARVAILLALLPFAELLPPPPRPVGLFRDNQTKPSRLGRRHFLTGLALAAVAVALCVYAAALLSGAATADTIRTPWDAVPGAFFAVVFMAAALAVGLAVSGYAGEFAIVPLVAVGSVITLAAAAVYAVGFGFDQFIHQSAERAIFAVGVMTPKTVYYIGQYAVVTAIAKLLGGHVLEIDRYLVPVAFGAVLPLAFRSLRQSFRWPPRRAAFAVSTLLVFPLAPFIVTTPQGLADVFALAGFFLALPVAVGQDGASPLPALLLTAAAAAVHPLAGVPLAFFAAALLLSRTVRDWSPTPRRLAMFLLALSGALAVPALFIINSRLSADAAVTLDRNALSDAGTLFDALRSQAVITRRFLPLLDFTYAWQAVRGTALTAVGLLGIFLLRRRSRDAVAYAVALFVFALDFVLLRTVVRFDFLVDNERAFYADRMRDLALLSVAPTVAYVAGLLAERLERRAAILRTGLVFLCAAVITASCYLAYPRRDKYESSRGWSTSAADVEAVQSITADAGGRTYAVLADQAVSAAAIREFGFRHYFMSRDPERPGAVFYYPVPTGGPLYAAFEKMNASYGSRASALAAMDFLGTDVVYFVVNHYWSQAQKIIIGAGREADAKWVTSDGRDYVFKYLRK